MTFLTEVKVELGKVTWPSQGELQDSTVAVFVTVVFFSIFIFVFDWVLSRLLDFIF
ncbi:MAG: preprotein translocase subunit SecE [Gemmatimonadetes bacterium]|nr:MAG: preprotein translocase subunit SecE [Gemmatimonadota bacterium]